MLDKLTPVGISSEVPVPVVAFTKGKDTDIRNVAADINEITMTPVCKEDFRLTNHYIWA